MPPDRSDDARKWLAALVARVEDDAAFLEAISDEEVAMLLAAEGRRVSGVAAAVRRRVREVEEVEEVEEGGAGLRVGRRPRGLWRWAAGVAAACVLTLVVWAAWPAPDATPVLRYRADLVALAGPPTKGAAPPLLARGARDLLAAAETQPPDPARAAGAAAALAEAAALETDPERRAAAAYFAALAYRLGRDEAAAQAWLRRVPSESPYGAAAAEALAAAP